jgi:hypothetical protein
MAINIRSSSRKEQSMGRILLSVAFVATLMFLQREQGLAQPTPKIPCAAPEYHQFDFFVGDWDAFDLDKPSIDKPSMDKQSADKPNTVVAHNRVDVILEGCVVLEDYEDTSAHHGESFSIYDRTKKMWHQTWVTNRGELLLLDGEFRNGQMTLSGHDVHEGKPREVRGVWRVENGGVRETAVESFDGGKTWQPWFDLMFRPRKR